MSLRSARSERKQTATLCASTCERVSRRACDETGSYEGVLQSTQRGLSRKKSQMARCSSRTSERATQRSIQAPQTEWNLPQTSSRVTIWDHSRRRACFVGKPGRMLCDLQREVCCSRLPSSASRPRSRNWKSSRHPVPSLQSRVRAFSGLARTAAPSSRIPDRAVVWHYAVL